jgi:hypothetical protein
LTGSPRYVTVVTDGGIMTKEELDSKYSALCAEIGHRFRLQWNNRVSYEAAQDGLSKEIEERLALIRELESQVSEIPPVSNPTKKRRARKA